MIKFVDIETIKPAPYNPRKISEQQFEKLKKSVAKLGMISPVLVNSQNNTIIAGHQRTKACKAIGVNKVPCIFVDGVELGDEIKFNQIHNAIDRSEEIKTVLNGEFPVEKFIVIDNKEFTIGETSASVVKEICKLINRYGNTLSCIICDGNVVMGENYVYACRLLNLEVNSYIVDKSKKQTLNTFIYEDYGEYSYDGLERKTFVQGLAQMHRLGGSKRLNKSALYESLVLPYIKAEKQSILDFGCGKGAYITRLGKNHNAVGVEFYNNNGKEINVTKGHKMIDNLIAHIKEKGLFDIVVCDSVLNSVDSIEAENSVIACLNAFCKINGKMFISGRTLNSAVKRAEMSKDVSNGVRYLEFLDENNFTANYRQGNWYYQHYNDREQIIKKLQDFGFRVDKVNWGTVNSTSFQIECTKNRNIENELVKRAIEFEFNLPLPNNKRYNRQKEVLELFEI